MSAAGSNSGGSAAAPSGVSGQEKDRGKSSVSGAAGSRTHTHTGADGATATEGRVETRTHTHAHARAHDCIQAIDLIPRFSAHSHTRKGAHGRVLVVGGSLEYTGAPYYAGISSLKTGADLCMCVCSSEAGVALKAYSPELIVHPVLPSSRDAKNLEEAVGMATLASLVERVDSVVIGPGLGRDPLTLAAAGKVLEWTREKRVPVVVDGDGLFLAAEKPELVMGHPTAVLTPNAGELQRLAKRVGVTLAEGDDLVQGLATLSKAMKGVAMLAKGAQDVAVSGPTSAEGIATYLNPIFVTGSPRRCGGQGDVLAGALGTFLAWATKHESWSKGADARQQALVAAASGASVLTRTAAKLAFARSHRATTTPDIIVSVGEAFEQAFPNALYAIEDVSFSDDA